jgi:hypothetical protein
MSSWGTTLKVISRPVAVSAGLCKGTYNVISGHGTFGEGYADAEDKVIDSAEGFGDTHGEELTKATIGLATTILGATAKKGIKNSGRRPPAGPPVPS